MSAAFAFGSENPADLLVNASCVTHFLAEAVVHLHQGNGGLSLSEDAASGLSMILQTVTNTISEALTRL